MSNTDQAKYCKYGDSICPCRDGDACHYEGVAPMVTPAEILVGMFPTQNLNSLARVVLALQRRVDELERMAHFEEGRPLSVSGSQDVV